MSTISWGRHEKYAFSSCGALMSWSPQVVPAVYAATYQRDPRNKPKAHTVFLFGETDDLAKNVDSIKRNLMEVFQRDGGNPQDLFIFIHPMNGSTRLERSRVMERLVLEYQPPGNIRD